MFVTIIDMFMSIFGFLSCSVLCVVRSERSLHGGKHGFKIQLSVFGPSVCRFPRQDRTDTSNDAVAHKVIARIPKVGAGNDDVLDGRRGKSCVGLHEVKRVRSVCAGKGWDRIRGVRGVAPAKARLEPPKAGQTGGVARMSAASGIRGPRDW